MLIIEDEASTYQRLNSLLAKHHPEVVIDVLDSMKVAYAGCPRIPRPEHLARSMAKFKTLMRTAAPAVDLEWLLAMDVRPTVHE